MIVEGLSQRGPAVGRGRIGRMRGVAEIGGAQRANLETGPRLLRRVGRFGVVKVLRRDAPTADGVLDEERRICPVRGRAEVFDAVDPDDLRLWAEAGGQLDQAEPGERVKNERQHRDHEDGAAVAQLVAKLAHPDHADDGPAHALSSVVPGP